mmetsp:Transcript_15658/g.28295  ORF Transcript_15658/g.28295 Transcript_15658/m.28295 type:complete len:485 (+) Transcript_15658:349-1803(+)
MTADTMTSNESGWPTLGNPAPPMANPISSQDDEHHPEWEMIAEDEPSSSNSNTANRVVILPGATAEMKRRPRSATIGHARDQTENVAPPTGRATTSDTSLQTASSIISNTSRGSHGHRGHRSRTLRRCASTPDLLMSDNAHELIVEDESDSESTSGTSGEESDDAQLIDAKELEDSDEGLEESFEVLSDKQQEVTDEEEEEEPIMIDEELTTNNEEEESATLVSTPSMGTSSWTMASSAMPTTPTTSVWGMKKSPSFADMLAKNISEGKGEWGEDKTLTESKLRDSHRRHHLRVRTKPKFVVDDGNKDISCGGAGSPRGGKMMKHAHSTGDLTNMLNAVEGGHESAGCGHGHHGQGRRRTKKQLSAMMEEDEEVDYVIGRGSGTTSCGGGGGGGGGGVEVMGDTDAMDYYARKEQGVRSCSKKKKERPDEAKRKEIIMHKKDLQRKKQAASQKGNGSNGGAAEGGGKKKKKNENRFGGKKERRR